MSLPFCALPLSLCLHRVNGRRVHTEPLPLPEQGCMLGSEGLFGEHLGSGLFVALRHAQIMPQGGHWVIVPGDPKMVCAVNGKRLNWGEPLPLGVGDSVQMGFTELRVCSQDQAYHMAAETVEATDSALPQQEEDDLFPFFIFPSTEQTLSPFSDQAASQSIDALLPSPESPALPPEQALLVQLAEDFSSSSAAHTLHLHKGQELDDILTPSACGTYTPQGASPAGTTDNVGSLSMQDIHYVTQQEQDSAEEENHAEFFGRIALPQSMEHIFTPLEEHSDSSTDPLSLDAKQAARSLEEILEGPLHIDAVLRSFDAHSTKTPEKSAGYPSTAPHHNLLGELSMPLDSFSPNSLNDEIPPDPLALLEEAALQRQGQSPSTPLSALLGREHHQPDIHSAYSPGGQHHSTLPSTPEEEK